MSKKKEVKHFSYRKGGGEVSDRKVIILRNPQKLYLGIDVSDLNTDDINDIVEGIHEADAQRDKLFEDLDINNRWRSFKPEGILWEDE